MFKLKLILLSILVSFFISAYSQNDSCVANIYFSFNDSKLNDSAKNVLVKLIKINSFLTNLKIIGWTDQVGTNSYNDQLSLSRANSVAEFLIVNGIHSNNISEIKGFGKRKPITVNSKTDTISSQLNRVVSLFIPRNKIINSVFLDTLVKSNPAPFANDSLVKQKQYIKEESPTESFQDQLNAGASKIILNNLNFQKGRHVLLDYSFPILHEVLVAMKNNLNLEIEIQGHICCLDTSEIDGIDLDTQEKALSRNRAKAVYEYLIANGIKPNRMTYSGFGSKNRLVYPERTAADAEMNRRVEFKIIKK